MSQGVDGVKPSLGLRPTAVPADVAGVVAPTALADHSPAVAVDHSAQALGQLAHQSPTTNAVADGIAGFDQPHPPAPGHGKLELPKRPGPNPARELVYTVSTAVGLADQFGGNAIKTLSGLPAVVNGFKAVAAEGGMFAGAAQFCANALGKGAQFAKAMPWLAATSNFLGKMAPVLGVAYAAFDIAKASLEPEGPAKVRMEGGALISSTSAALGIASAAAGSVAATAAALAASGVTVVGAATLAAPLAIGLGVAALGFGLFSMADGLFNGGRAQSWLGQTARNLTGRNPLFW